MGVRTDVPEGVERADPGRGSRLGTGPGSTAPNSGAAQHGSRVRSMAEKSAQHLECRPSGHIDTPASLLGCPGSTVLARRIDTGLYSRRSWL